MGVPLDKILVVGAGIGGLSAAIALRRQGYVVELCEQRREHAPVGAGIILTVNARRALRELGIDRALGSRGNEVERIGIATRSGRPPSIMDVRRLGQSAGTVALAVHRRTLQ